MLKFQKQIQHNIIEKKKNHKLRFHIPHLWNSLYSTDPLTDCSSANKTITRQKGNPKPHTKGNTEILIHINLQSIETNNWNAKTSKNPFGFRENINIRGEMKTWDQCQDLKFSFFFPVFSPETNRSYRPRKRSNKSFQNRENWVASEKERPVEESERQYQNIEKKPRVSGGRLRTYIAREGLGTTADKP